MRRVIIYTLSILLFFLSSSALSLTLNGAIEEALRNNFLIKQREEMIASAVEGKKVARSLLLPKLSFSYSYQRLKERPFSLFENPLSPGQKYKVHLGDRDRTYWDITISQPIFTGFSLITRYRLSKLNIDLKKAYRDQALLDVEEQVKISYFQALLAKKYIEIAKEEVSQLKSHLRDAKNFFSQGLIPYNDLLKSEVALAQAKQNLVKAKSRFRVAVSRLNTVLEREIDESTELEDITAFAPKRYELNRLYEIAIKNRPEIRALRIAMDEARQRIRLAKSRYYPSIYLVARYEQQGTDLGATENDYGINKNASIGIEARWDIFEWGRKRAEVSKARHEYRAIYYEFKKLKDQIRLEVKDAFENLNVALINVETAKKALDQARENYRITNLRYQEQLTNSTEVLDARTYLTQAEVNYYNALYGYMIAKAKLEHAIGERYEAK